MKKIITCYLILNFCFLTVAEETHVDYKRQDGIVTRVTYSGPKGNKTVSSKKMDSNEYEAQKAQDESVAMTKAVFSLIGLVFKWMLTRNRQ